MVVSASSKQQSEANSRVTLIPVDVSHYSKFKHLELKSTEKFYKNNQRTRGTLLTEISFCIVNFKL